MILDTSYKQVYKNSTKISFNTLLGTVYIYSYLSYC